VYFTKATNSSSFESSEKYMLYANKLQNKNDLYYRTLTSLYINQINNLIVKDKNAPNLQNSVQSLVYSAQRNATQSVATDSNNYSNWLLLGQFFEFTTNMQIAGDSYKNGMVAYDKVAYFVPASPSIPVYQARLEIVNKNVQGAQDLITKALSLKKDYSEAFKLRAQIAYDIKDYKEAINQLSQAISYNPNASDLYVSRGTVYMQINSYTDAVNDYRKALSISPSQNTGFLLAQADIKAGFTDEAKTIIDALLKLNPDNNDLKDMNQRLQEPNTATITDQPAKDAKKVDTKK
jgi:tetratricopeptide (TPR) repeat protein